MCKNHTRSNHNQSLVSRPFLWDARQSFKVHLNLRLHFILCFTAKVPEPKMPKLRQICEIIQMCIHLITPFYHKMCIGIEKGKGKYLEKKADLILEKNM